MKSILNILFITFLFNSCTKNITAKLSDAKSMNVIFATVTDYSSMQTTLSQSVPFYADNDFPTISGAKVNIVDSNANISYNLTESNYLGYYLNTKRGRQGKTYKLNVIIHDTSYTATATMPHRVALDSVTFKVTNSFGTDIIRPILHFQDPKDTINYYRFIVTNITTGKINSYNLSDRLSDGRYMDYALDYDSAYIHVKDTLEIELRTQNKSSYDYYNQIENSAGASEKNTINTAPDNPSTNINNNALGIFDVYTRSVRKTLVPSNVQNGAAWTEIWIRN